MSGVAGDDEAAAPGRRVEAPVRVAERWLPGRVLSATPGERRAFLAAVVQGYARRIAIVGALASAFFVVDHVSKLIAAIVPPDHFVTNDVVGLPIWAALVPIFVVALLGNRLLLLSGGLMLGGTMGNAVDAASGPAVFLTSSTRRTPSHLRRSGTSPMRSSTLARSCTS